MAPTAATKAATNKAPAAPRKAAAPKAEPAPKKETEAQLRNRLRNEAEREVINNHKPEFVDIATKKFAEHGLTFSRRLSDKEKAAKAIADQLNMFPELRAMFATVGAAQEAKDQGLDLSPDDQLETVTMTVEEWEAQQAEARAAEAEGVEFREGE
jgi:hypothetical protein